VDTSLQRHQLTLIFSDRLSGHLHSERRADEGVKDEGQEAEALGAEGAEVTAERPEEKGKTST
jgi:hypothetical protein